MQQKAIQSRSGHRTKARLDYNITEKIKGGGGGGGGGGGERERERETKTECKKHFIKILSL